MRDGKSIKKSVKERAGKIRLLLLDVDGVLTSGQVLYDGAGREYKSFHIQDGHGIKLLQRAGLEVGILSGRRSAAVSVRARELGIRIVVQRALDKGAALQGLLRKTQIPPEEVCYVGDDLVDLPVFSRVGFAVAVPNGVPEVCRQAHYVTSRSGGQGAVREVCELLLKAQGKWQGVTQKYFLP